MTSRGVLAHRGRGRGSAVSWTGGEEKRTMRCRVDDPVKSLRKQRSKHGQEAFMMFKVLCVFAMFHLKNEDNQI